jgi:hypothetical protein
MRCPLADRHDFEAVDDPELGEIQVCRDCDAVALPPGLFAELVLNGPDDWEW